MVSLHFGVTRCSESVVLEPVERERVYSVIRSIHQVFPAVESKIIHPSALQEAWTDCYAKTKGPVSAGFFFFLDFRLNAWNFGRGVLSNG